MLIKKRNGSLQKFDWNKLETVIIKAFKSVGKTISDESLNDILDELYFGDSEGKLKKVIEVEDLQDQIEEALFELGYFDVAKAFILYRNKHKVARDKARKNIEFIESFIKSSNSANATIDDNSNVSNKNIAVLNAEIHKEDNKNTNMELWEDYMLKLYPDFDIKQMRKDFNTILYPHDSSSQVMMPYCMAVSMYPFLLNGLKDLGGKSAVPKNIDSFCGIYVNLVFALASEVKGAVATPEFLLYFDYFARKEWGDDYYMREDCVITTPCCARVKTIGDQINQYFQQVTYSINQIAGSRGAQSPFTNFSFFDKYFFEGMFSEFRFPDGTPATWESVNWVQQRYLHWLNQERLKCLLTFPVCSYACLAENGEFKDKETFDYICNEYVEGNSFFLYLSDTVDSLSSCCRLQNSIQDNTFNYTSGMVGVMTGSKNVITLNLNRIIQDFVATQPYDLDDFLGYLKVILERVYKYQYAYNEILHYAYKNKLFSAYSAGFIDLNKQYLTIGINGLNQAAEYVGLECKPDLQYKEFCTKIFKTIKEENRKHKTKTASFNTEQVPAESAAIKLYNRDKADGYWVPEDTNLYASYIFKPNDTEISVLDKITLHSALFAANEMDGGQACHINLQEHLSKGQYENLLKYMAEVKCNYATFNIPNSECESCGYITKHPINQCPKCGSFKISLWDRIIGYLTKISNWSDGRQKEQKLRVYSEKDKVC